MSLSKRYTEVIEVFDKKNSQAYLQVELKDLFYVLNVIYCFRPADYDQNKISQLAEEIGNFEGAVFIIVPKDEVSKSLSEYHPKIDLLVRRLNAQYSIFQDILESYYMM